MAIDPISAALDIGGKLIDRLWPDPTQRDAAKLELLKMQQTGELAQMAADTDLAKSQAQINVAEAQNANLFVSGWRPFIGWICGSGLGYQFLARPILQMAVDAFTTYEQAPRIIMESLDVGTLLTLLLGMLGLGTMRTFEKFKGVV